MFGASKGSKETIAFPPTRNRRRYARVDSLGQVFASLGAGQEGTVLNISFGGMLVRLKRMLTPGSSYFLKLFFGAREAVVEARVVRLLTRSEDYLAGMEFLQVSALDREVLRRFLGPSASEKQ